MADNNSYKIELGVKLNTSDLASDLKDAIAKVDDKHKVKIGVDLKVNDIRERISQYNQNSNNAKLKLKIKLDTDDLNKQIRALNLGSTGGGKGVTIPVNTQSLENSLKDVKDIIASIHKSLGALDDGKGMKSLLSSVNQIADALGKATNESETLVKSLNALSGKDLNFNFGINMGGANPIARNAAYGNKVRKETLPQLKQQVDDLVKYYNDTFNKSSSEFEALQNLVAKTKLSNGDFFQNFLYGENSVASRMNNGSLASQMQAYREYIDMFKQAASLKGLDLTSVTSSFSKSADDLIKDAQDIQTGVNEASDGFEKLKQVFNGGGVDAEGLGKVLEPIIADLGEIKKALQEFSNIKPFEGLTQSLEKLDGTLDKLLSNVDAVKKVVDAGLSITSPADDSNNGVEKVVQDQKELAQASTETANVIVQSEEKKQQAIEETAKTIDAVSSKNVSDIGQTDVGLENTENDLKQVTVAASDTAKAIQQMRDTMESMNFNHSSIDAVAKDLEDLGIQISKISVKDNVTSLNVAVEGIDSIGRAVTEIRQFDKASEDISRVSTTFTQSFNTSDDFIKEINREMANFVKLRKEISQKKINIEIAKSQGGDVEYIDALEDGLKRLESSYDSLIRAFTKKITINADMVPFEDVVKFDDKIIDIDKGAEHKIGKIIDESNAKILKEINSEMADFVRLETQIGNMRTKIGALELVGDNENQVAELNIQLQELEENYARLMHTFTKKLVANADIIPMDDIARFDDEIIAITEKTGNKLRELDAKIADTKAKLASDIKLDFSKFDTEVLSLESNIGKLSNKTDELENGIKLVKEQLTSMKSASTDDELIASAEKYKQTLKEVENQLKQNQIAEQKANDSAKLKQEKQKLTLQMGNWLKDNSAAAKDFGARIKELQVQIDACDSKQLDGLKRQFQNIKQEAKAAGKTTKTFGDSLKAQFAKYSSYLSIASLYMYAEQGLRDMFEQVKLIDSAMTELKKVTNETDASYNKFLSNAAKRSKELGTTIDGLVSSTADFARLGYGFKDAQGLAEVANIYAVVGDEINGVEGATESLISTMAAFKDEMNGMSNSDFAMSIVDKMNEVSNNYAISSGGLGEALKRSSSAMFSANNTLDETIALITASNTVVQDADVVGNAYKTIALRIRGAKSELEEMGEDTSGMAESSAKLREELLALSGVDILEADGKTFKSTYDILNEISKVYHNLSDLSQANILEKLAGKRQSNILSAALENFDIARDALETSLGSEGSAMAEHAKWSESLEANGLPRHLEISVIEYI